MIKKVVARTDEVFGTRKVVEEMLRERIDDESAGPTVPDQRDVIDVVLPADNVWTMA